MQGQTMLAVLTESDIKKSSFHRKIPLFTPLLLLAPLLTFLHVRKIRFRIKMLAQFVSTENLNDLLIIYAAQTWDQPVCNEISSGMIFFLLIGLWLSWRNACICWCTTTSTQRVPDFSIVALGLQQVINNISTLRRNTGNVELYFCHICLNVGQILHRSCFPGSECE